MKKVYVEHASSFDEKQKAIKAGLEWIDWETLVPPNANVFIKPNLTTYPIFTPGVTTSPDIIDALLAILIGRTRNITIGESDGGRHAWTADDAFRGHNLYDITRKYDIHLINLSHEPCECAHTEVNGKSVDVELPSILLHDLDVFISLPVPKLHSMTYVSMAFKNQWGCLPDVMRFRNHPNFDQKIIAITKLLPRKIVVFDGAYFLDNNGPLLGGIPIKKDLVIVSDDFGAGSLICCEIMGIPWKKVSHFKVAYRECLFPNSISELECNIDVLKFRDRRFKLHRTLWNFLALVSFKSPLLTWLVYDSLLDKPLHWLLYLFRKNPVDVFKKKKEDMLSTNNQFYENRYGKE